MDNNFSNNLKHLRIQNGLTQEDLAKKLDKDYSTIGKWENGTRSPIMADVLKIADFFNVSLKDLIQNNMIYDNAEPVTDTIKIPIYGSIKAGLPLESQNDIIDYMDIPREWSKGKRLFGLRLSGDSMFPKYQDGEVVIFKQDEDLENQKNKDCAIMINHTESTFKKLLVNDTGIVLQPYNANYDIMMFTNKEIEDLPITVLGIAIKKVSDVE